MGASPRRRYEARHWPARCKFGLTRARPLFTSALFLFFPRRESCGTVAHLQSFLHALLWYDRSRGPHFVNHIMAQRRALLRTKVKSSGDENMQTEHTATEEVSLDGPCCRRTGTLQRQIVTAGPGWWRRSSGNDAAIMLHLLRGQPWSSTPRMATNQYKYNLTTYYHYHHYY